MDFISISWRNFSLNRYIYLILKAYRKKIRRRKNALEGYIQINSMISHVTREKQEKAHMWTHRSGREKNLACWSHCGCLTIGGFYLMFFKQIFSNKPDIIFYLVGKSSCTVKCTDDTDSALHSTPVKQGAGVQSSQCGLPYEFVSWVWFQMR